MLMCTFAAVSGCDSGSPATLPVTSEVRGHQAGSGGTLTLGIWSEPASFLDAGVVGSQAFAYVVDAPVMEGLLWYRSTEEEHKARSPADYWVPWLATEVPTLENGDVRTRDCPNPAAKMCVTWKLRDGVRWHDGHTLSSHDVCDTFQLFFVRYGSSNPTALADVFGWDQVIDCNEKDSLTAVVDFKSEYGPYLRLGSGVYGILPSTVVDRALSTNGDLQRVSSNVDLSRGSGNRAAFRGRATLDDMLDGTGPFVFSSHQPGNRIELVRNQHYWNADHQPQLGRLVFEVLSDVPAEAQAATSGRIDMAFDMRVDRIPVLRDAQKSGRLALDLVPASGAEKLDFNLCANERKLCGAGQFSPYTADPTVRRAILLALDRKAIIDKTQVGPLPVPKDSAVPLGASFADDPAIPSTRHDVAAANALLDGAHYFLNPHCGDGKQRSLPDGSCITVNLGTTRTSPDRLAVEVLIRDQLSAVGIAVVQPFSPNLEPEQFFAGFASQGPLSTHSFDIALYASTLPVPGEPDGYYARFHGDCGGHCRASDQIPSSSNGGVGGNDTGENDASLDHLLDEARGTVDAAVRVRDYREVGKRLARDLPEIPLYRYVIVNSHSPALRGVRYNDAVWDYNSYDWSCQRGVCHA